MFFLFFNSTLQEQESGYYFQCDLKWNKIENAQTEDEFVKNFIALLKNIMILMLMTSIPECYGNHSSFERVPKEKTASNDKVFREREKKRENQFAIVL